MTTPETVTIERLAAERAWLFILQATKLDARLTPWEESAGPSGPVLSARVVGPDAAQVLLQFADTAHIAGKPGELHQRTQLDCTMPGRVACVWQSNGVWLELWHPDGAPDAPEPTHGVLVPPAAAQAAPSPSSGPSARRAFLLRPGGRLPFTRKQRTTDKETTTT